MLDKKDVHRANAGRHSSPKALLTGPETRFGSEAVRVLKRSWSSGFKARIRMSSPKRTATAALPPHRIPKSGARRMAM